ncbi:HtaA domain-containing protein [Streptomyces sp. NPDC051173]|uniref:HtaA domain-containing protein n=1 Tax=Streptomyces sp. NPDC051173 TaxID=3155164 RepID=UPI00344D6783
MSLPSRPARLPALGLLTALLAALVPMSAAHAAESREIAGGRLDWGIKSSFQSYVTGPAAHGSWELRDGAATEGDNQFRFHSAKGSYDSDAGAFDASFQGGVHFTGHKKPDGSYDLDLTLSSPAVGVSGGKGTLYADMTGKSRGTGEVTTATHVPFASLDLSGVNLRGDDTAAVTLTNVPATLTAEGEKAFAGYYKAGTALDPVSLSADVGDASAATKSDESDLPKGEFKEAAVDWGVRRTFREYVSGPIAQGSWKVGDGAQDGGALFRFPKGKGAYDGEKKALDASFDGTLHFTGKHLDLTLGGVKAAVKDGKGTLSADVTGGSGAGKALPLVTFDASELTEKDGLAAITAAPAKLTAEGAKAFGGVYKEGADMDPVSLAVPLTTKAKLPALPNLGKSSPSAPPASAPAPESAEESSSSDSFPVLPVVVAGVGALMLVGVVFLVIQRRRAVPATGASDSVSGE